MCDFDHCEILNKIGDQLKKDHPHYQSHVFHEDGKWILDVYTGFSGLQFSINESGQLVLWKESWYSSKVSWYDDCEIIIGIPSFDNVMKTIDLFVEKGRAGSSDESMELLLSKNHSQ